MEHSLEGKYQELLNKYSGFVPTSAEELEQILVELNLIKPEDSLQNAQILCHGAGESGIRNLDGILNHDGLRIKNRIGNNYVAEGILSTNVCMNDENNNVNIDATHGYKYNYVNENGEFFTIVSAVPIKLEQIKDGKVDKMALGRIIHEGSKTHNCILDDAEMETLPKEFILGVIKSSGEMGSEQFQINPNFFALNEQNFQNAIDSINNIFANSKFNSLGEYYDAINGSVKVAVQREKLGLPVPAGVVSKYRIDACKLNEELKNEMTQPSVHYSQSEEITM